MCDQNRLLLLQHCLGHYGFELVELVGDLPQLEVSLEGLHLLLELLVALVLLHLRSKMEIIENLPLDELQPLMRPFLGVGAGEHFVLHAEVVFEVVVLLPGLERQLLIPFIEVDHVADFAGEVETVAEKVLTFMVVAPSRLQIVQIHGFEGVAPIKPQQRSQFAEIVVVQFRGGFFHQNMHLYSCHLGDRQQYLGLHEEDDQDHMKFIDVVLVVFVEH